VALALGGYILLCDRQRDTTDSARATRSRLFPELSRQEITRVGRQQQPAGTGIVLERQKSDGDRWLLMPERRPADSAAVEQLLAQLELVDVDRVTDAPPASVGLDPPGVTLELFTPARSFTLHLGRRDPAGRGVYVRRADRPEVLVADGRLLDLATGTGGDPSFRDRHLLPPADSANPRPTVTWKEGDATARSLRFANGFWINGQGLRVSRERAEQVVRALAEVTAARLLPSASVARDPPRRTVEVDRSERLSLGFWDKGCGAPDQTLARRDRKGKETDWLCLPSAAIERLWTDLDAAAKREMSLRGGRIEEIAAVTVTAGARRLKLRREGSAWKLLEPATAYGLDNQAVADWLSRLTSARLEATPPGAGAAAPGSAAAVPVAASAAPFRRLVFEAEARDTIDFSAPSRGFLRVVRHGESAPGWVADEILPLLDPDALGLRDREVLSFARHDARHLRLTSATGREEASKNQDESWRLVTPTHQEIATDNLDRLLGTFTNLRAQRFLPPSTAFRAAHTIEVVEDLPAPSRGETDTTRTHRLEIGPPIPEGCLARLSDGGKPLIFLLPPGSCADLYQPLINNRVADGGR
jgi:hypothetical protein